MSAPPCCLPIGTLVEERSSLSLVVSGAPMRKRVLLSMLAAVTLATAAATYWPLHSAKDRIPRSASILVSLIGQTNGNVAIRVRNGGSQRIDMVPEVLLEYRDLAHPEDYHPPDFERLTNGFFSLAPRATFQACFPAPTKHRKLKSTLVASGSASPSRGAQACVALQMVAIRHRAQIRSYRVGHPMKAKHRANPAGAVDAPIGVCLRSGAWGRRATDQRRSALSVWS